MKFFFRERLRKLRLHTKSDSLLTFIWSKVENDFSKYSQFNDRECYFESKLSRTVCQKGKRKPNSSILSRSSKQNNGSQACRVPNPQNTYASQHNKGISYWILRVGPCPLQRYVKALISDTRECEYLELGSLEM